MLPEPITYRWLTRETLLHEVKENPRLIKQLAQFSRLLVELAPTHPNFASVEPCAKQLVTPAKIISQLRHGTHLLLAVTPNGVVGAHQIDLRRDGLLYNRFVAVHPDYQRRKIGKHLILRLIGLARKNQLTEFHSGLDTPASNRLWRKIATDLSHRSDLQFEFEPIPIIGPNYTHAVVHVSRRKANKTIPRKK
jgi:GNAT superfamily N-acetyltransferase